MDNESLHRVVKRVLTVIEEGQEAIFDIAESTRCELERLQSMLETAAGQPVAVHEAAGAYVEAASQEQLELKRNSLAQVMDQSDLLLIRFGVALQALQGILPDSDLAGDWNSRQQVGQLVIRMLDNERCRIAREIHDGPAQTLANLLLRTMFCEQRLAREAVDVQGDLLELKDVIRASLQDIRKILFDLRTKDLGLEIAGGLRRLIDNYQERYGLQVMFTCTGQERGLSAPTVSTLFRIVQEALNNVYRHSCSHQARVGLELKEDRVTVRISDDGKGFDLQTVAQNNGHYGLLNMRERARLLDGSLQIQTVPGQGTEVSVTIPIKEGDGGLG